MPGLPRQLDHLILVWSTENVVRRAFDLDDLTVLHLIPRAQYVHRGVAASPPAHGATIIRQMRRYLILTLLIFVSILPGCATRRQGIREITLSSGGEVAYTTGHGGSSSITFRRDGTAEMRSTSTENFVAQAPVIKRAQFSTDQFERLAATMDANGFFEKKENEGNIQDAWQSLKVVTTTGDRTIQTLGRNDPQIKTMVAAVDDLAAKVQWKEVDH